MPRLCCSLSKVDITENTGSFEVFSLHGQRRPAAGTRLCAKKCRGFLIVLWLNYYLALADVYLASHRIGECAEAQLGWGARSSN